MMYPNSTTLIRYMADDEKPREKALAHGIKSLTNVELMAIVFATGLKGKSVIDLSREILNDNDNHLSMVAHLSPQEFMNRYKGIGPAKAVTLLAALELGMRSARDAAEIEYKNVNSSSTAFDLMRHHFQGLDHEEFWVLMMSNSAKVIREVCVGQGGQTSTTVDVKVLMRAVLEARATRIIVFHNHPSGNLAPSMPDDALTRKIKSAVEFFDVRLDDHIIVADRGYYSYNDEGRL
jgi:DNA repair protein RadC